MKLKMVENRDATRKKVWRQLRAVRAKYKEDNEILSKLNPMVGTLLAALRYPVSSLEYYPSSQVYVLTCEVADPRYDTVVIYIRGKGFEYEVQVTDGFRRTKYVKEVKDYIVSRSGEIPLKSEVMRPW